MDEFKSTYVTLVQPSASANLKHYYVRFVLC